jgi:hypothetical protein
MKALRTLAPEFGLEREVWGYKPIQISEVGVEREGSRKNAIFVMIYAQDRPAISVGF